MRANASTLCDMFLTHLVVRAQHAKTIRQDVLVRAPPSLLTHVRAHPFSLARQHRHLLRVPRARLRPRDRCTAVLKSTFLIRVLTRHRCSQLFSPPPDARPVSSWRGSSSSSSCPAARSASASTTRRARMPRVPASQPLTPGCDVRAGGLPIERVRRSQEPDSLVPIQSWGACHRLLEPA